MEHASIWLIRFVALLVLAGGVLMLVVAGAIILGFIFGVMV